MNWKTGMVFVLAVGLAAAWWMGSIGEGGAIEGAIRTKFEELEQKLETQLPKDVGVSTAEKAEKRVILSVRPGPLVETPDGEVLDLAALGAWVTNSSELCDDHGVSLFPREGATYADVVDVVDVLFHARIADITFAGVKFDDAKEER